MAQLINLIREKKRLYKTYKNNPTTKCNTNILAIHFYIHLKYNNSSIDFCFSM